MCIGGMQLNYQTYRAVWKIYILLPELSTLVSQIYRPPKLSLYSAFWIQICSANCTLRMSVHPFRRESRID